MNDTTTVDSQAEETNQSQADETQTDQPNTEPETISLDEARKLRNENKSLRTRAKTAEEKLEAEANAKLTESEKLQKQFEESTTILSKREGSLKTLLLQGAVQELKEVVGLRSTKSILRLLDIEALEFDLDGLKVKGVDTELKRLKKEDPDLFITGGTDGGAGGGGRGGASPDMNSLIRGAAGRG